MKSINDLHVNANMLSLLKAGCVISMSNNLDATRLRRSSLHNKIVVEKKWGGKRFPFSKDGLIEAIEFALNGKEPDRTSIIINRMRS